MGNISGNHDLPRFISFASGALRFDEDPIAAGWDRQVEIVDPVGYQKLQQLLTFISTIPGLPVVYAGDDIGMVGAGDPDNRRFMIWEDLAAGQEAVREHFSKVAAIRQAHPALRYGSRRPLVA
jgi:glycosidase